MSSDELDRVRALAAPLLAAAPARGVEGAALFAPHPEDYTRVFAAVVAPAVEAHFQTLWTQKPAIAAKPGQTELRMWAARPEELVARTGEAIGFPRGYTALAPYLAADRVWIAWKYVRPGTALGMAYDGLVWLDDRFAWLPKPWRATGAMEPSLGLWAD